ncbi:MAG: class I SAM-dependent RNA methyltransferase [Calditrichaeota bacterium]|nr:class I SAM-dependent RNA methyltransferase [Calditrichota bacterium]
MNSAEETDGRSKGRIAGDVSALSSDGRGIIRTREAVYFAERVVPGDRVAFTPDLSAKPPVAESPKVLKHSPDRCAHPCKAAAKCPSSTWGIVGYSRQLSEKAELVKRVLRGAVEPAAVQDIWPSPLEWGYRSRVSLRLAPRRRGGFALGYAVGAREADLVEITGCLLASEPIRRAIRDISDFLADARELSPEVIPHRLSLYETASGVGGLAVYRGRPKETDVQNFLEFAENFELFGGLWATGGTQAGVVGERGTFWRTKESESARVAWFEHFLDVHPAGFAQVNSGATGLVLETLRADFGSQAIRHVWDLYGGFGGLGFSCVPEGSSLTVVEQSGFSESTFEQLRGLRPGVNARFVKGDVMKSLSSLRSQMRAEDLVILDPPRAGCHPEVLEQFAKSKIRRVVYLSCNPARLARDLKLLVPAGFVATRIQPVDFFPQTPEIEALAYLERRQ